MRSLNSSLKIVIGIKFLLHSGPKYRFGTFRDMLNKFFHYYRRAKIPIEDNLLIDELFGVNEIEFSLTEKWGNEYKEIMKIMNTK